MLLKRSPLKKCMRQSMQAGRLMRKIFSSTPAI